MPVTTRQRSKRARVPLVARTHKKPAAPKTKLPRAKAISDFHTLLRRKQILEAVPSTAETIAELSEVEGELAGMGGLEGYQAVSVRGEKRGGWFTTAKWVMERLSGKEEWKEVLAEVRPGASKRRKRQRREAAASDNQPEADERKEEQKEPAERTPLEERPIVVMLHGLPPLYIPAPSSRRLPRLLDVGSLGNPYQPYAHLLDLLPIDLNPQHPSVRRMDFFDLSSHTYARSFDCVVLSLVLNFVPLPTLRGRMLRRSAAMLRLGGWLYCMLPAACVNNCRWVDESVVRELFGRCGLRVTEVHYSRKIVLVEATTDVDAADAGEWKSGLVRRGEQYNNFSIALEAAGVDTGQGGGGQAEKAEEDEE